jgi:hypothetical protein
MSLTAATFPLLDGTAACAFLRESEPLTPEEFGARGDGVTNDSGAFAALAAEVSRRGGGVIDLRPTTYLVGAQTRAPHGSDYTFAPKRLMEFVGCSHPLVIHGNGAKIRCADGLRYGTFSPSGAPTRRPLPNLRRGEWATPYSHMIFVDGCANLVEISDLELDGNLPRLLLGGPWGDTGHQIPGCGIGLYNNIGPERLKNIHTHHHGLDGIIIDGFNGNRKFRCRIENLRSEYNGRQGCSIVGGRGYDFIGCRFNHTGRSAITSSPGAGVDIEAENKQVRDLSFIECEFANNSGCGVVADSGDSEGAVFDRCTFIGTTMWSAWPKKPGFRFTQCSFTGAIANAYWDAERPERATKFIDCRFRDNPVLSPNGKVYGGPVADLPRNPNVVFQRCSFTLTHAGRLPWTTDVTYVDCTMSQRSPVEAYPRGRFLGRNTIIGKVDLNGSTIEGELILNGARISRGKYG